MATFEEALKHMKAGGQIRYKSYRNWNYTYSINGKYIQNQNRKRVNAIWYSQILSEEWELL